MSTSPREQNPPQAASIYEPIAEQYAAVVDTQPYNAYYERPAMLALLPPLANTRVLDVGCGSGWYAEYLLGQGAIVTAFDVAPTFVALTKARVGDRANVHQADLNERLSFATDGSFDLIICPLVLHYVQHWEPVLQEFHRILRPLGVLVFSTHHPYMDWQEFKTDNYFRTEVLEDTWKVGKVWFYRRPLTAMSEALSTAGFVIERIVEPQPTEEFRRVHPEGYERLTKNPGFLIIRARHD